MTCEEAIQFIHSTGMYGAAPGLSRIRTLLEAMGDPQKELQFIHVAGTNGKGSVCAMLDAILRAAGYRVGLFTSPYIRFFEERIRVDGEPIASEVLADITEQIRPIAEAMEDRPTEFELITAIGFEFFRRQKVEVVVLEVGLGGRFDPTNIIESPCLSVITGVDFDHMERLGNTLQAIAAEKAGIIKENCPCLYGAAENSACRTVRSIAKLRNAPFYTVDRSALRVTEMTLDGTRFDFNGLTDLRLVLLGSFQPINATTVLSALELLGEVFPVNEDAIRQGLTDVRWQARFELLCREPIVLYDGGHNSQGVGAAVSAIQTYFPEQKVNVFTGVMADKGYDEMIEKLKPVTAHAFTVSPGGERALRAEDYAAHFEIHKISATAYATVEEGLRAAVQASREEGIPLLCLGSLYLYRSVADALASALK